MNFDKPPVSVIQSNLENTAREKVSAAFEKIVTKNEYIKVIKAIEIIDSLPQCANDIKQAANSIFQKILDRTSICADTLPEFQMVLKVLVDEGKVDQEYASQALSHENAHANQFEVEKQDGGFVGTFKGYKVLLLKEEGNKVTLSPAFHYSSSREVVNTVEGYNSQIRITEAPKINLELLQKFNSVFLREDKTDLRVLDLSDGDLSQIEFYKKQLQELSQEQRVDPITNEATNEKSDLTYEQCKDVIVGLLEENRAVILRLLPEIAHLVVEKEKETQL